MSDTLLNESYRTKVIVRTGIIGILANVVLFVFKLLVGIFSGSVSVIMDAVNNLSDAFSSTITIGGAKLSRKPADKGHPLGHGRIEYLSAVIISFIILAAAFTSGVESIRKIITPNELTITALSFIVIGVSIGVKIILGIYTRYMGVKTDSEALKGSGIDALFDALVSSATLVSLLIYHFSNVNVDGWFGILVALAILKGGIDLLRSSTKNVLGARVDKALTQAIKETLLSHPQVRGVHDLYLDDYGHNKYIGFAHIEVNEDMKAYEIDELTRHLNRDVLKEHNAYLTFSIYSIPIENSPHDLMKKKLEPAIKELDGVIEVHGFHVNEEEKVIYFDVVRDFSVKDIDDWMKKITETSEALFPGYEFRIEADVDYSD